MYDDSEEFMIELTALVAKYSNYEAPRLKADGDLIIPLPVSYTHLTLPTRNCV